MDKHKEEYSKMVAIIRTELALYIEKYNLKSLVIGISGGIDSALCAAIARPVCDKLNIPLIGRSIPIATNTSDERDRADLIGAAFCTNYDEVYYAEPSFKELRAMVEKEDLDVEEEDRNSKIRLGNVKARLRMIYLYDLAQLHNGMVLSTDNYTEYLLGFWTLHGDVGDYGMLQNLWKTEVYEMADFLIDRLNIPGPRKALQACIDCQATDGLGISSTDLDQIMPSWEGTSRDGYAEVDNILKKLFEPNLDPSSIDLDHPVIRRHFSSQYKRTNPYNIKRSTIIPPPEKEYKKRLISVPIVEKKKDTPFTKTDIDDLNLLNGDEINIKFYATGWVLTATRKRMENDSEFKQEIQNDKDYEESERQCRYQQYLVLKKEFET